MNKLQVRTEGDTQVIVSRHFTAPPDLVYRERMHLPDPTPDNLVETLLESDGQGGTNLTMRMTLPDAATRAAMLATGMEHGMEASYARLEQVVFGSPGA